MQPTVEQVAEELVPLLAKTSPKIAIVVELAPAAISLLQQAFAMHSAGVVEADTLAAIFANVGAGIKAKHDEWAARNAASAS